MSNDNDLHAVIELRNAARNLNEQAMFAHKTAQTHSHRTRRAIEDLAALDLELVFSQLRQMVAIVSGKPTPAPAPVRDNVVPLAAE